MPGEIVTFFTDGSYEAESPGKVRFGVERALAVIRSERKQTARTIIEAFHNEIVAFTRHRPQLDDISIVVVKVE